MPDIEGLDSFPGHVFHSARWDHSVDLNGKRIGVVGSGASAIQIVPEMQKIASELVVFQRSAPYMNKRNDHPYTEAEKRTFERNPDVMNICARGSSGSAKNNMPSAGWSPNIWKMPRRWPWRTWKARWPTPNCARS